MTTEKTEPSAEVVERVARHAGADALDRAVHPAVFMVLEEMFAREWSLGDLVSAMNGDAMDRLAVEMLLLVQESGLRLGVMAEKLARAFGVSTELFENLEKQWLARLSAIPQPAEAREIEQGNEAARATAFCQAIAALESRYGHCEPKLKPGIRYSIAIVRHMMIGEAAAAQDAEEAKGKPMALTRESLIEWASSWVPDSPPGQRTRFSAALAAELQDWREPKLKPTFCKHCPFAQHVHFEQDGKLVAPGCSGFEPLP
jgi:hypothetical protein